MHEAENTFRALKDEAPLATGRLCWLGFHKWTMYSKPFTRTEGSYQVDYQTRMCAGCGVLEVKVLRRY